MMKKQWKKEQRICSACQDKAVIDRDHDGDLCPGCARDFENRMMARSIAQQPKVVFLDDYRTTPRCEPEAAPVAAAA